MIVKRLHTAAAGLAVALGLGLAAAAIAESGPASADKAPHGQAGVPDGPGGPMGHGGMGHGGMGYGGMGPGGMGPGGTGPNGMGGGTGPHGIGPLSLMTPEERSALREQMRNAKTSEERQTIAQAAHDEMQKRAKEKGVTLPQHGGRFHVQ